MLNQWLKKANSKCQIGITKGGFMKFIIFSIFFSLGAISLEAQSQSSPEGEPVTVCSFLELTEAGYKRTQECVRRQNCPGFNSAWGTGGDGGGGGGPFSYSTNEDVNAILQAFVANLYVSCPLGQTITEESVQCLLAETARAKTENQCPSNE